MAELCHDCNKSKGSVQSSSRVPSHSHSSWSTISQTDKVHTKSVRGRQLITKTDATQTTKQTRAHCEVTDSVDDSAAPWFPPTPDGIRAQQAVGFQSVLWSPSCRGLSWSSLRWSWVRANTNQAWSDDRNGSATTRVTAAQMGMFTH